MFWVFIGVIALLMILNSTFGQALATRIERRGPQEPDRLLTERIAFLESEVERLRTDVGRLDEETDFLQKLLAERPPQEKSLPPGESPE